MTKNEAIEKVLNLARSEIGNHEQGDNVTKYAAEMDRTNWYNGPKNGYPWCDIWYDWLFYKCFGDSLGKQMICQPAGSAGAGCLYSAQYYKQAGRWTNVPEKGAQIFFSYSPGEYSHTGIVESVENGVVTTIEGNTSDSVGRRQYQIGSSVIAGYGIPRWELATGSSSSVEPSAPVVKPDPEPVYTGLIRKGAKGAKVKELQENLIKLGYDCGPDGADGDFGNNTYNAVVKFQREHGCEVDGIVGDETRAAIEKALKAGSAAAVISPKKFKKGDTVNFKGGMHYIYADKDKGSPSKPGKATITIIKENAKHPYHIVRIAGSGTNVFGWVDADTIEAI